HGRRRTHYHARSALAAVATTAFFVGGKNSGVDPPIVDGALYQSRHVLRREIAKLLSCAHLRRKLTSANFSGKTARSHPRKFSVKGYALLGLARPLVVGGACSGSE